MAFKLAASDLSFQWLLHFYWLFFFTDFSHRMRCASTFFLLNYECITYHEGNSQGKKRKGLKEGNKNFERKQHEIGKKALREDKKKK